MRLAVGFRVKTGRAVGLGLLETEALPRVVSRHHLALSDSEDPDSRQPYHAALELSESEAEEVVSRVTRAVKGRGISGMSAIAKEIADAGYELDGIGIVTGSLADPSRVSNPHIRAHALEGKLFREAVEEAAQALDLPSITLVEKEQYDEATRALGRSRESLDESLREIGRLAGRPWRGEEKSAALAAWIRLSMNPNR